MKKRTSKKRGAPEPDTPGDGDPMSRRTGDDFLVVGIGASAGGIKALKEFFARVPSGSGMAYVVILHLSPEHESHLAEVLQAATEMPVTQVRGSVRIEPNRVYVIPPNKSLAMSDGRLALSRVKGTEERRAPVDIFFRTLAESKHERAVSVVLSGTGADGSMGMKRVKEMGGVCVVQDPREAEYSDMPRHSIATGLVDYVLPVAEIPQKLVAYSERLGQTRVPVEELERPDTDEQALRQIFTQLRVRTGHDFSNYKRATVLRRIERRINVHELADLQAYALFMREHPDEARALLRDLLISVTNFFRDCESFEALERGSIRRLFQGKGAGDQVRVWAAGCATGEEAYTLAMLLCECAENLPDAPTIQVFATDIDEQAIAAAREGFYTEADVADVSPERLRRFFVKEANGGYRVRRELREMVLFAHHNLIKDPPFSHLDLISCRNLLIYLNRAAQGRVMQVLHFALNPGGFLFLRGSESVDGATDLFLTVDKVARVYQSRAVAARLPLPIPDPMVAHRAADLRQKDERVRETRAVERLSYADLHQRLVEQYMPPSVVVNEEYDIVHLSEHAGRFMQVAGGEPSHNLLKMVRPEIRTELRTALYQAVQNRVSVEARNIPARLEEGMRLVNLQVRPVFSEGDNARGFILVVFDDAGEGAESAGPDAAEMVVGAGPAARQLEDELVRVKAQLRATIEQYETQTEELKASNEELQAMNEELRSTAEELETSKEELQSVNEELTTVNQELKIKIEELSQANDDFRNLMNSTDIGTIFLDRSLRLKLFTPRARDIFNLIPADVGRPLSDITAHLNAADLLADAEHVLASLQPVQRAVETREGRWYLMNVLPYRTVEDRIEGVVLTFPDITERKLAEKERFLLASIVESSEDAILTVDFGGEITSWNKAAERLYGYMAAEAIGKPLTMLTLPEDLKEVLANADKVRHGETVESYDTIRLNKDGREMNLEVVLSPVRDGAGRVIGVSTIARDVTERRRTEALLQASEERLRLLIESVTDYAIIIQDMNGRIEVWNPGAERMFGYTAAEAVGQSVEIIFTPEDRAQGAHLAEMKRARERGIANDERWHLRKDGSRFYVSGVLTLLRDGGVAGYAKIARDLTESQRTQEALRRAHEELEQRVAERTQELAEANEALRVENAERRLIERARLQLLRQLVRVQDDERRRIARDIHDHLGQQSTALRLKLESIKEQCLEYDELCEPFEQTQIIAARLDADVDFLAWELRPAALDDLGLASALANFVKEWSKHFGIPAEFHTTGMDKERPAPEIETNLYRIAQEALNNTYKHARASRVDVLLERRGDHVALIVEDDGVGFEPNDKAGADRGLGLLGMGERARLVGGTLEIESAPGVGTTVFARVPLSFPEEGAAD